MKGVGSGETPSLTLNSLFREGIASCSSDSCRVTDAGRVSAQKRVCLGPEVPPMQQRSITPVCPHRLVTSDKPKDPANNSESSLKGEKTTWEEAILASDWLGIFTESH